MTVRVGQSWLQPRPVTVVTPQGRGPFWDRATYSIWRWTTWLEENGHTTSSIDSKNSIIKGEWLQSRRVRNVIKKNVCFCMQWLNHVCSSAQKVRMYLVESEFIPLINMTPVSDRVSGCQSVSHAKLADRKRGSLRVVRLMWNMNMCLVLCIGLYEVYEHLCHLLNVWDKNQTTHLLCPPKYASCKDLMCHWAA